MSQDKQAAMIGFGHIPDGCTLASVLLFYIRNKAFANITVCLMKLVGMLGHSISILLETYTHFIPTMQSEAAQLINGILTPISIDLSKLKMGER